MMSYKNSEGGKKGGGRWSQKTRPDPPPGGPGGSKSAIFLGRFWRHFWTPSPKFFLILGRSVRQVHSKTN